MEPGGLLMIVIAVSGVTAAPRFAPRQYGKWIEKTGRFSLTWKTALPAEPVWFNVRAVRLTLHQPARTTVINSPDYLGLIEEADEFCGTGCCNRN